MTSPNHPHDRVRITGTLRDVIISDVELLAEKHRVKLTTIAKMIYAEVRSRAP